MIGGKSQKGDLENPGFGEHFHKHSLAPSTFGNSPIDGMPAPASAATPSITLSPEITSDTFICMGDLSKFVIRNELGRVELEFEPHEVERGPDGRWWIKKDAVSDAIWKRASLKGVLVAVEVQPVRPQCRHYRRTLIDMPNNPEHRYCERVCMAARDENGQFVSINDVRIHACELREPRHAESETKLDAFDEKAFAKAREETSEFDLDGALAEEAGGIFK